MINMDDLSMQELVGGFVAVSGVLLATIAYLYRKDNKPISDEDKIDVQMDDVVEEMKDLETKKQRQQRLNDQRRQGKDASYDHPWYVTTLKGHTTLVTDIDFAPDGKKFVSISNDRSVYVWDVRDFEDREHKCSRQKIDFDTPTKVAFGPDSKSLLFSVERDNRLVVSKLAKQKAGFSLVSADVDYPKKHEKEICAVGFAGNAKYVMSASLDQTIALYDIRGSFLKSIDSKVSEMFDCRISPDGRFISACGFTPDVFVYEPTFQKDSFVDAKKVFSLTGHGAGVFAAAFSSSCSHAVTVSRDGFWRVFNTDIRYAAGQDAKVIRQGEWKELANATAKNVCLAMSGNGESFAVAVGRNLKVFSTEDEKTDFPALIDLLPSSITAIRFSPEGKFIAASGDKFIRVLRNVPQYQSIIVRSTRQLDDVTAEGARRRLKEQIEEARAELEKFQN